MVDKFFNKGGYKFLSDLEEKFNCASVCSTPLFYITKDVKEGPPTNDCVTAAMEELMQNQNAVIICAATGILLLISISGAFVLCSKP